MIMTSSRNPLPSGRAIATHGWPTSNRNGRDQIGIGGRLLSGISGRLAPESAVELIRRHVLGAARLHGDDTTVPVLAKGKTLTGRVWTYVRDDRPFAGPEPPAAMFFYSRNRDGEHPGRHLAGYGGLLQADAYGGFNGLYDAERSPRPITEAASIARQSE